MLMRPRGVRAVYPGPERHSCAPAVMAARGEPNKRPAAKTAAGLLWRSRFRCGSNANGVGAVMQINCMIYYTTHCLRPNKNLLKRVKMFLKKLPVS